MSKDKIKVWVAWETVKNYGKRNEDHQNDGEGDCLGVFNTMDKALEFMGSLPRHKGSYRLATRGRSKG